MNVKVSPKDKKRDINLLSTYKEAEEWLNLGANYQDKAFSKKSFKRF